MDAVNQDIAYLSDIKEAEPIPSGVAEDNIAVFGQSGKLKDSGKKLSQFYTSEQVDQKIEEVISSLEWDPAAVYGEYAISAYISEDWESGTVYEAGSFCLHGSPRQGYRCKSSHTSAGTFNPDKWELVLSSEGKTAIDGLLAKCGRDKAPLLSLASAYNPSKAYSKGELAIKDGKLQIATVSATGAGAAFSDDVTLDRVISERIKEACDPLKSRVDEIEHAIDELLGREEEPVYNPYVSGPDGYAYRIESQYDSDTDGYDIVTSQTGVPASGQDVVPVYAKCYENLLYYEVTVVRDLDTDEIVPNISQTPVSDIGNGKCPIYLGDGNGLYHELVAVIDPDMGQVAIKVKKEGIEHE